MKKEKKNSEVRFSPQWLVRIRFTSEHFKEGRGEEKPEKQEGEEEETEGGREVGFPLPGFHLNAHKLRD